MSNFDFNALYKTRTDKIKACKRFNDNKFVLFLQAIWTRLWKNEHINISIKLTLQLI